MHYEGKWIKGPQMLYFGTFLLFLSTRLPKLCMVMESWPWWEHSDHLSENLSQPNDWAFLPSQSCGDLLQTLRSSLQNLIEKSELRRSCGVCSSRSFLTSPQAFLISLICSSSSRLRGVLLSVTWNRENMRLRRGSLEESYAVMDRILEFSFSDAFSLFQRDAFPLSRSHFNSFDVRANSEIASYNRTLWFWKSKDCWDGCGKKEKKGEDSGSTNMIRVAQENPQSFPSSCVGSSHQRAEWRGAMRQALNRIRYPSSRAHTAASLVFCCSRQTHLIIFVRRAWKLFTFMFKLAF